MNTSVSAGFDAVFSIFRARDMFVADELRLRSLRALWRESNGDADQLDSIIAEMRDAGLVDLTGDMSSACVRLTSSGFDAMRKAAALPAASPPPAKASPQVTQTPPRPTAAEARRAAPRPRRAQPLPSPQGPADPLHLQVMLALLKHLKVRAGGSVPRQGLAVQWSQMKLDYADLVRAIDELLGQGVLAPDSRDPARVRLTTVGFARVQAPPADMAEARLRIEASRYVRRLKQLGAMKQGVAI